MNLVTKRNSDEVHLIKQIKDKIKQGIRMYIIFLKLNVEKKRIFLFSECHPPSKYFSGSCYTYMKSSLAPSWERAHNNCLSLSMTKDSRLLSIETIDEYEFIERELIGLKSGSESVSVFIGLRKINSSYSDLAFFAIENNNKNL